MQQLEIEDYIKLKQLEEEARALEMSIDSFNDSASFQELKQIEEEIRALRLKMKG